MPIFELGDESIVPVELTSFASTGHRERDDLQRLLRDQIEVVASDVLIIAEEFGEWSDSRRRIDLLGIDKKANLVVIELKRTDDGGHMELQALRYSGMISTLTAKQAIEAYDNVLGTIQESMQIPKIKMWCMLSMYLITRVRMEAKTLAVLERHMAIIMISGLLQKIQNG